MSTGLPGRGVAGTAGRCSHKEPRVTPHGLSSALRTGQVRTEPSQIECDLTDTTITAAAPVNEALNVRVIQSAGAAALGVITHHGNGAHIYSEQRGELPARPVTGIL